MISVFIARYFLIKKLSREDTKFERESQIFREQGR